MADVGVFPSELATPLAAPSVASVLLARFDFGDGEGGTLTRRFHAGVGKIPAGGYDWEGVTDPGQTRVVSLSAVKLPSPKVAAKVDVTLSGIDRSFLAQLRADVGVIYTAAAEIYLQVGDPDTYEMVGNPVVIFRDGVCGMPKFAADRQGRRAITIPIEGIWANKNYAPGGRLNDASQKARYAGDRGGELIGSTAYERIK